MSIKIAKYRKEGHPGEWWLTDFTMEQVEGRLNFLELEYLKYIAVLKKLDEHWERIEKIKSKVTVKS